MKFIRSLLLLALLAVSGNALVPFLAQQSDKILICTATGYRFVSAQDVGTLPPFDSYKPHCVMCVLAAQSHNLTPPLDVAATLEPQREVMATLLPDALFAIPRIAHKPDSARAPPVAA